MDYLQKKIIQKNEEKINLITQKMEKKLKKSFKQLTPKNKRKPKESKMKIIMQQQKSNYALKKL